jgi:hypothetical protein
MADVINHGTVYARLLKPGNVVVRLLIFAFVVACVFDPADQIFGAKVWGCF